MATEGRQSTESAELDALSLRVILCDNSAGIKAVPLGNRADKSIALDASALKVWVYVSASTAAASAGVLVPDDNPSAGRWHTAFNVQSGTATLAAGTATVVGVRLTASSRIYVAMKDAGAGAITGLGALEVPVASRNTATGQFVVRALDDSKAVIATAVSTFDWLVVDAG